MVILFKSELNSVFIFKSYFISLLLDLLNLRDFHSEEITSVLTFNGYFK